ncbi:MAG: hypothetical protein MRY21_02820 [Simkaniaceae bacterium]|nr:hypothetical protein [Simkaniaceae bacterium]
MFILLTAIFNLFGNESAQQVVTFDYGIFGFFSILGPSSSIVLVVNTAEAGSNLKQVSDERLSLCYQRSQAGGKMLAYIDRNLPENTQLEVKVTTNVGDSTGTQILTTYPVPVVTDIDSSLCPEAPVRYTYSADVSAGVIPASTYTVTFLIVDP